MNQKWVVACSFVFMLFGAGCFGQNMINEFQLKSYKTNQPNPVFHIPSLNNQLPLFSFIQPGTNTGSPMVLKSPVCYTAFFCKMEVKTAQKLGIMIKVHAGDYDAYTGGNMYPKE